jgi:hypothetical protein
MDNIPEKTPEKADKKTIGVTPEQLPTLNRLKTAGHFANEFDAAKFAMAYAIDKGVSQGSTEGAGTKWNVGSFDSDGGLKAVIEALFPEEPTPYRRIEHLINEGLRLLDKGNTIPPDVASLMLTAAKT